MAFMCSLQQSLNVRKFCTALFWCFGAVSSAQVIVDLFLASWNKPVGVHIEVGTCVDQETPFANLVCDE
jgi:hypothetical protein